MNIPNLPTDNLYKFIALSGVIVIILSVYFEETKLAEVAGKIIETTESTNIARQNESYLSKKIERMQKLIDDSIAEQNGRYTSDKNKLVLTYSNAEIKAMENELQESALNEQIELIKVKADQEQSEELLKQERKSFYFGLFIIFAGLVMAYFGFTLWYRKVQEPHDLMLKRELEKSLS